MRIVAAGIVVALAAVIAGLAFVPRTSHLDTTASPRASLPAPSHGADQSASPSPPAVATGPTAVYSILGKGRLTLYERRLDGVSMPTELAWRPADREGAAHFIVGPNRNAILVAQSSASGSSLEPISLDRPDAPPTWTVKIPWIDFTTGVWSRDGRYWAGYGVDDTTNKAFALVVDTTAGEIWKVQLRQDEWVQGFDGPGLRLVLRDDGRASDGSVTPIRFATLDPETNERRTVDFSAVQAPPHSSFAVDVAPATGLWVTEGAQQDGTLLIGDLRTGAQTIIDRAERTFHWMAFFPDGNHVAAMNYLADKCGVTQHRLIAADVHGGVRELWRGAASPLDFVFAPEGDMVGFDAWGPTGSSIVVADSISGRWVTLPLPDGAYLGELLALRGGSAMPESAIPAPAPVPSATTERDEPFVEDAPQLAAASVDFDPDYCAATIQVRLLAPTVDGGIGTVAELPPVFLPDVEQYEPWVGLAPRPGSREIAVSYGDNESSHVLLWTPTSAPGSEAQPSVTQLAVPVDWPVDRSAALIWRPDGQALGFRYSNGTRTFLWFELGDTTIRRLRAESRWSDVIGWSRDGASIVVRRGGCIDSCNARYSWLSLVGLQDGQTRDISPAAPIEGIGSGADTVSLRNGLEVTHDVRPDQIRFSTGINYPGEFTARWPAKAGFLNVDQPVGVWSRDGRRLYVAADTDRGRELFRVDDPRADARLHPVSVGLLPAGANVGEVEIAVTWVTITISELGTCSQGLVELVSGRAYLTPCFGGSVWYPGS